MDGVGLLAHQGGWDEILLVAGPVLVFVGLLVLARRRALALAYQQRSGADRPTDPDEQAP